MIEKPDKGKCGNAWFPETLARSYRARFTPEFWIIQFNLRMRTNADPCTYPLDMVIDWSDKHLSQRARLIKMSQLPETL